MFGHDICSSLHNGKKKPFLKEALEGSHFSERPYS
jgi:hypothetical protein